MARTPWIRFVPQTMYIVAFLIVYTILFAGLMVLKLGKILNEIGLKENIFSFLS